MKTLTVTKDNYLGLCKCQDTDQPKVKIKGSFYFYLEDIEIGGTNKKKVPYYKFGDTLYNEKSNHDLYEGELCKIELENSFLEQFEYDVLISLEDAFEEYFEEFAAQEADDEWKYLNSLPY